MTLKVGHRIILRDGCEWSVLAIDARRRIVRLGDQFDRPRQLRVIAFAEVREVAGWDRGDGTLEPLEGPVEPPGTPVVVPQTQAESSEASTGSSEAPFREPLENEEDGQHT